MKNLLLKRWPFLAILLVVFIFFWKVFLLGQAPIPGDFIVGAYFPWLDYKWGYQVGVPVKNPITSDVVSIVYPLRSYAVDRLKTGHLPLWNPFMFGGTPLLADFQVGVLSPTMIFYFLLPKIWAWTSQIMIQPILAAIFTYLLLRNFGLKKLESFFGGIFYAFSAFNIIWMEWNANALAAAFIPLLILLLDKFIRSDELQWGIFLSIGICLQIFAGYPQLVAYTIVALLIFTFFRRGKITRKKFFLILLFVFAGLLLSSIILIPGAELILNSQRRYEVLEPNLIYLPWQSLITFFAPDYFGNPATINYFGIGNYTINAGYSGVVVLILSIVGVLKNWGKKEVKYFVTLVFLSLLFALPTPFAVALFNSHIPAISASSATRILVLANLSLSVLAGFGVFSLLEKAKIAKIGIVFIPFIILIGVLVLTLFVGADRVVSLRNLVLPITLSLLAAVLILLRNRLYKVVKLRLLFILIICFIAIAELFRYGWKYIPFSYPKLVFPETPIISFFKNVKAPFRVSPGNVIPMNMLVPYNLETVSGYDAVYPIWWAKLNCALNSQGSECATFTYYATFELYGNRWFDLLNNEYLLVLNSSDKSSDTFLIKQVQNMDKFRKVFQDKSVAIFKNNDALPRAFFVTDWESESDTEALKTLIDPNFPLGRKIIISGGTNLKKNSFANSSVAFDSYSPEKSTIDVKTDKEGFLFVTDAWYPGWKAKVDGVDTSIYRADFAFRAVALAKGVHKVEFRYEPDSLKTGELVSVITALFLAGTALFSIRKSSEKVFS